VLNVLIDIFQELAFLSRADGQTASEMSADTAMQTAIILYSALKAHKFMAELIERRLERHPVMAPTFNGFLFSERVLHGNIRKLEIKIGEISNITRTLQSKVDKKS
jgi:siroheme synthase